MIDSRTIIERVLGPDGHARSLTDPCSGVTLTVARGLILAILPSEDEPDEVIIEVALSSRLTGDVIAETELDEDGTPYWRDSATLDDLADLAARHQK